MNNLNDLIEKIKNIMETVCNVNIKDNNENYFDSGVDSYSFMEFLSVLEGEFNIVFDNDEFANDDFFTIKGLAEIIKEKKNV